MDRGNFDNQEQEHLLQETVRAKMNRLKWCAEIDIRMGCVIDKSFEGISDAEGGELLAVRFRCLPESDRERADDGALTLLLQHRQQKKHLLFHIGNVDDVDDAIESDAFSTSSAAPAALSCF